MNIHGWLHASQPSHSEGLQLLESHGGRPVLVRLLRKETTYNRKRLRRELAAIASKQPKAAQEPASRPNVLADHRKEIKPEKYALGKTDRFPERLQPAVKRLRELYDIVNHLHPLLDQLWMQDRKECHQSVQALIAAWDEINEIYRLLNYYDQNGEVLPSKYTGKLNYVSHDRTELLKRRNNLRTYISRYKGKPSQADKLREYQEEMRQIEKALEAYEPV